MALYLLLSDIRAFTGYPNVPWRMFPFSLCTTLSHLGWSVQACSRAQNPVRHEPALPANWSCLKPQAQALQHLSIYLYNHLKGGCKAGGQSQPFFSDAQWQDQIRVDWNKLEQEDPPEHLKTCSTVMVTEHSNRLPVLLKTHPETLLGIQL